MTIKRLTIAAAIALAGFTPAFASCPAAEQMPVVTGAACPVEEAKPMPSCNKCKEKKDKCGCKKAKPKCGCQDSTEPGIPAATLCPQSSKVKPKDMLQVYGYPNAIYGANNYMGEPAASTAFLETPYATATSSPRNIAAASSGVVVSTTGEITGAATPVFGTGLNVPMINQLPCNECDNIDFQSSSSIEAVKKSVVPYDCPCKGKMMGAASGLMGADSFPDVPDSFWASCDIDKLAINDVVVGYPDGLFRPNRDISRAEFATMLVKGFNMSPDCGGNMQFSDVPACNWANGAISKAAQENLLTGCEGKFHPSAPVTRLDALSTIAKGMNCPMDECKANEILGKYSDGASIPEAAKIAVAKSLENGALKGSPTPNLINPNEDATRADVSSMLQTVRVALGYDTNPETANDTCPVEHKTSFIEQEEIVKIPTLKVSMIDQINAKSSHVGQYFKAKTLEEVTINGTVFPCGSIVSGRVVEVVRPSGCNKGALKLSFTDIKNDCTKVNLPKQIMQAQVGCPKQINPVARLVEFPFTLAGSIIGTAARTVGGAFTALGNASENVLNDGGYMLGNAFNGEFGAAGRSLGDGVVQTVMAPVNVVRTGLTGVLGLFETTGDEVAYLVNPKGYKISAVNSREQVTIAFGCTEE